MDELKREVSTLSQCKADFYAFSEVERDTAELQQYIRRNNIEIWENPESVNDKQLEDKVIEIGKAVNINFNKSDVEACHRLPLDVRATKDLNVP